MKKLMLTSLFCMARVICMETTDPYPKNIFDAMHKAHQDPEQLAAVTYYAALEHQVNLRDVEEDGTFFSHHIDEQSATKRIKNVCRPACCCLFGFLCFPICCTCERLRHDPLYLALNYYRNLDIAQILIKEGADVTKGEFSSRAVCHLGFAIESKNKLIDSSLRKLVELARTEPRARELLNGIIEQSYASFFPHNLHSNSIDLEVAFCTELLQLGDNALMQTIVRKQLVDPALLACVAAKTRNLDAVGFLRGQKYNFDEKILPYFYQVLEETGYHWLVDMFLDVHGNKVPYLLQMALERCWCPELVNYLRIKRQKIAEKRLKEKCPNLPLAK